MIALQIGSTGLVGTELTKQILDDPRFEKLICFNRRKSEFKNSKLEELIVNFDDIDSWKDKLQGDVLFSSLGTTIKKAGSKEKQYLIDFTYQFEVAKAAANNNVPLYCLVSSYGAKANSSSFYTRIKGELDQSVKSLPFKHSASFRPSILQGKRKEHRFGEALGLKITPALAYIPFLKKFRPTPALIVAKAMKNWSINPSPSKNSIFSLDELYQLAKE